MEPGTGLIEISTPADPLGRLLPGQASARTERRTAGAVIRRTPRSLGGRIVARGWHAVFISIEEAIRRYGDGEILILVDDENRENEGDFAVAAEHATAQVINFMITHGRGLVCTPITEERARELDLSPMCPGRTELRETRFTVSVDARDGITTGISVHDRARTIRLMVEDDARPEELVRPGHVFPLIARDGGVLRRAGHTEATVDLARLAGLKPAAVLCEILDEDGTMARGAQLEAIAERHSVRMVHIGDLIEYRKRMEQAESALDAG